MPRGTSSLNYRSGFATQPWESDAPQLWKHLRHAYVPSSGHAGIRLLDFAKKNHAALSGGYELSPHGVLFDGVNGQASTSGGVDIKDDFMLAFWFRSASTTQTQTYLIAHYATNAQSAVIYEYVDNTIEFFASSYTGSNPRTGSGISITDTEWHHIAYRYDGTTWSGYKDGIRVFNSTRSFTLATSASNSFYIGSASAANYTNGDFDSVLVYNPAPSESVVRHLASDPLALFRPKKTTRHFVPAPVSGGFQPAWANRATQIAGVMA